MRLLQATPLTMNLRRPSHLSSARNWGEEMSKLDAGSEIQPPLPLGERPAEGHFRI